MQQFRVTTDLEEEQMEAERLTKEKRAAELLYQNTYHRLRKTLLNKVDEFQSALMAKGTELLPSEYWGVCPQVMLLCFPWNLRSLAVDI